MAGNRPIELIATGSGRRGHTISLNENNNSNLKELLLRKNNKDERLLFNIDIDSLEAKNAEAKVDRARPIEIVTTNDDNMLSLRKNNLKKILMQDEIKDRSVVVVSVAGAFRSGKSFLLNIFLRYLYAQYKTEDVTNWLDSANVDEPVVGFRCNSGTEKSTTSILMWSDIFKFDSKNGDKIAIILLDTQALSPQSFSRIFALSTLCSSIQCFNLLNDIEESDLIKLKFFTEFGQWSRQDYGSPPFQRLEIIVRDWYRPWEYKYGPDGGKHLLESRLHMTPDLKQIEDCFGGIECFTIPNPGATIAENPRPNSLRNVNVDFMDCLRKLVPSLLAPENLIIKKINGQKVVAKDLVKLFGIYLNAIQKENILNARTFYSTIVDHQHMKAVDEAKEFYNQEMMQSCGGLLPKTEDSLKISHNRAKQNAIQKFRTVPKMGREELTISMLADLKSDLEDQFLPFIEEHKKKRTTVNRIGIALRVAAVAVGAVASANRR